MVVTSPEVVSRRVGESPRAHPRGSAGPPPKPALGDLRHRETDLNRCPDESQGTCPIVTERLSQGLEQEARHAKLLPASAGPPIGHTSTLLRGRGDLVCASAGGDQRTPTRATGAPASANRRKGNMTTTQSRSADGGHHDASVRGARPGPAFRPSGTRPSGHLSSASSDESRGTAVPRAGSTGGGWQDTLVSVASHP